MVQVAAGEAAANEMKGQMQVIAEMLEAARAIAHKSLQEQESIRMKLANAVDQLKSATQVTFETTWPVDHCQDMSTQDSS